MVSCFNSSDKTEAVKVEATGMAELMFFTSDRHRGLSGGGVYWRDIE